MNRVWIFQDHRQKAKLGRKAKWSVGWLLDGRRRSRTVGTRTQAKQHAATLQADLVKGLMRDECTLSWEEFRQQYEAYQRSRKQERSLACDVSALNHFERLVKPRRIAAIRTHHIDEFVAKRSVERGAKKGSTISPATINLELRHLRAAFNFALERELIRKVVKVSMLPEIEKLPRFVSSEHFASIYTNCDAAKQPGGLPFDTTQWWRSFLVMAYMTGWRRDELLSLRWSDVDLDAGSAVTRKNKGKREEQVPLHPVVVEHLRQIRSFEPLVFPWYLSSKSLYVNFHHIQRAAGISLDCSEDHEHSESCRFYGFHDLRRAFASENAMELSPVALQQLMRHKSFSTTQRYINIANRLQASTDKLHVPDFLKKAGS